jgi:hypothetical protein
MLLVTSGTATAAFAFSVPSLSIVAGPGLGMGGPTVFNTYSHDLTTLGSGAAASAAANVYGAPSYGASTGVAMPFGPACPPIPGYGCGIPSSCYGPFAGPSVYGANPYGADQAVNQQWGNQAMEDNTFATNFYSAGGSGPYSGLCNAYIAGNAPQEFSLQFF